MKANTYRHQGHYGIVFNITSFLVTPQERATLRELFLCELDADCHKVSELIVEMYDRMLAGNRACEIVVSVSAPLLRNQADLLNSQRVAVSRLISTAVGSVIKPINSIAAAVTAGATNHSIQGGLRTYHVGDILVSVQASVSGGIGPQRSSKSLLIKSRIGS